MTTSRAAAAQRSPRPRALRVGRRVRHLASSVLSPPSSVLALAAALRCYRLDGQSLWYDEGVSAFMTTRGPVEIARAAAADIHPPLYYWLLAAWAIPFGDGEIALRAFSVVCGTLMVWVVWRLGCALYDDRAGLAAGALVAVSPLAVHYGQEVRMYALAGLLAAAATWAYLALVRSPLPTTRSGGSTSPHPSPLPGGEGAHSLSPWERAGVRATQEASGRHWVRAGEEAPREVGLRSWLCASLLYGVLAAALLYTHYYGALILAVHQLHLALRVTTTGRWSLLAPWLLGTALALALYLPWLPSALRQTGYYPGLGTPQPSWALAVDAANVLSLGVATTRFAFRPGLAPFVALALLGLAAARPTKDHGPRPDDGRRRADDTPTGGDSSPLVRGLWSLVRSAGARALLVLWLALPIGAIIALSTSRPVYEPRFLMLVLPAWAILVGAGAVTLGRVLSRLLGGGLRLSPAAGRVIAAGLAVGTLGLLLVPTTRSLTAYYFDPAYARDDYRGLAQRIGEQERPGDAVILTAPGQAEVFGYYYRGRAEVFPLPAQRPIDPDDTLGRLAALAARHRRVWLVRWAFGEADPDDLIGRWLEAHARPAGTEHFGRVELLLYKVMDDT